MFKLTKLDTTSEKGERRACRGIETAEAKQLLAGFDFNAQALLKKTIYKTPKTDMARGTLHFEIVDGKDISYPKGATHAEIKAAYLLIDLERKNFNTSETNTVSVNRRGRAQKIRLEMQPKISGNGKSLFILRICFFKEVGKTRKMLGKEFNCCAIVGVL